jgi:ATP/maltotriose-dependent transcriptional regulator MalT
MAETIEGTPLGHATAGVSPVFVGREQELSLLTEAYETARAGSARVVLLGGEAGVGKTRLVGEFAARVHGDGGPTAGRVLVGGCLELSASGLPYAPFTGILRQLVRDIGMDGLGALMPGGRAGELARLLPGLGDGEARESRDAETGRVRLFEQLLTLLGVLADNTGSVRNADSARSARSTDSVRNADGARSADSADGGPLLLIVEDAHWADRSTRDLISFLSRNLHDERLLIVITFRSDELNRTHPLRPLLAELDRAAIVDRTELPRLSRSQVAAQLDGILGRSPHPELVSDVYGRSSGIPLFVEALAGCADDPFCSVPESLRDLLLASVLRLPEETQDVLRIASAADRVGHELLATVTGLADAELSRALRPAVEGHVLVTESDQYAFRHALIREAIHDDLLPGEHTRLHRTFAEALERDPGLCTDANPTVTQAQHWHHAHVIEKALPAAWRAAGESGAALAFAEQVEMLERVLELWDRVPGAAELVGHDQVEVMRLAADAACNCGEIDRGLAFVRAALAETDETTEPERTADLLVLRSKLRSWRADVEHEDSDLWHALRLVPDPGLARSRVLSRVAMTCMVTSDVAESLPLAREAVEIAERLDDHETRLDAAITMATITSRDGTGGVAGQLLTLLEQVRAFGYERLELRLLSNLSHIYEGAGEPEKSVKVARQGLDLAKRTGRVRTDGAFVASNLTESLLSLGRWDEALEVCEQVLEFNPARRVHVWLQLYQARIMLARGDLDLSGQALRAVRKLGSEAAAPQTVLPYVGHSIAWSMARGDRDGALDALEDALGREDTLLVKPRYTWPLLYQGMRACADIVTDPASVREPGRLSRATEIMGGLRAFARRTPADGALAAAFATAFTAESSRGDGMLDRLAWDTAAAAWEALRRPYPRAVALLRAAEAAAADGERDAAAERLTTATELARDLGARPLLARLEDLSRRARLSLGPAPSHGLTARELDVLRLVAEGRSNREIADALFISTKTASVHVSNILGKLGVTGRGEAAATAHRLALFHQDR